MDLTQSLEFFLAYRRVTYGIPVEVEAFDIESNLVGSHSLEKGPPGPCTVEIVTGDPVIIGLNSNIAFKSLNLYIFLPLKPFPFMNSLNSLCFMG